MLSAQEEYTFHFQWGIFRENSSKESLETRGRMARIKLASELERLDHQLIELGERANGALAQALSALEQRDYALARQVISADDSLDALRTSIEAGAMMLLALHRSLSERNLRYLVSALTIASNLERIGDGAAGIAKNLLRPAFRPEICHDWDRTPLDTAGYVSEATIIQSLLALGTEARRVLHGTMQALAARDTEAARILWREDDVVDVRYHLIRHDLMSTLKGLQAITAVQRDPNVLERATYYLWMAHKLERVADHCTTICERIVFFIEGQGTISYLPE
jgi:phosphate transport system protein